MQKVDFLTINCDRICKNSQENMTEVPKQKLCSTSIFYCNMKQFGTTVI